MPGDKLEYVKMEGLSLDVGETTQVECPSCGRDKLSITRDDEGLLFNCWRPSCSFRGMIGTIGALYKATDQDVTKKIFKPNQYTGETEAISEDFYADFLSKYEIPLEVYKRYGVGRIKGRFGIVFPLRNHFGLIFGHSTKFWDQSQKSIHYLFKEYKPPTDFGVGRDTGVAVLVEDKLSALKIDAITTVKPVALLGTHFSDERVRQLKKAGIDHVILWLDPDAREKAVSIRNKWGLFFSTFKVIFTDHDPKDTPSTDPIWDEIMSYARGTYS